MFLIDNYENDLDTSSKIILCCFEFVLKLYKHFKMQVIGFISALV